MTTADISPETWPAGAYRWRGIDHRGRSQFGVERPTDLAAWVEARYNRGWRELIVCSGYGPVPPRTNDLATAGAIERPMHGRKRIWWAESAPLILNPNPAAEFWPVADHTKCPPGSHDFSAMDPHYEGRLDEAGRTLCNDCGTLMFWCTIDGRFHHVGIPAEDGRGCFTLGPDASDVPVPAEADVPRLVGGCSICGGRLANGRCADFTAALVRDFGPHMASATMDEPS